MYHVQQTPEGVPYHVFHLFIATPERVFYDDQVLSLKAPGSEGCFEILVNHAPFMAILKEGKIAVRDKEKNLKTWHISGGYFEISHNKACILADTASETED